MRLLQFLKNGRISLGLEKNIGGDIIDLSSENSKLPNETIEFIEQGPTAWDEAKRIAQISKRVYHRDQVQIIQPLRKPDKILCVGHNYKDHCEELGLPLPKQPVFFNKFPSTIIGPNHNLPHPEATKALDYEVELAIIIGKAGKNIKKSEALDHIFGYTIALDISARDLFGTFNSGQWLLGKSMDGFCPLGPTIVTSDEIKNPHNLSIKCAVNGVNKQNSNTKELVHQTESLVEYISRYFTLLPGDVILTGTPPGIGGARNPPEYLQKGDRVECELENIGKLAITIV